VGFYIWETMSVLFPRNEMLLSKKIGFLVKKSSSLENEFMAKLFLQKSFVLVLSLNL
jgi:hypothetical protein